MSQLMGMHKNKEAERKDHEFSIRQIKLEEPMDYVVYSKQLDI